MNFRRYYIPGSTVFITQVVEYREPVFSDPRLVLLLWDILQTYSDFIHSKYSHMSSCMIIFISSYNRRGKAISARSCTL